VGTRITPTEVLTKGGSIGLPGATIAAGMVFEASGYSVIGGMPGNAVLAFKIYNRM
jgi:hypothetical protein